MDQTAPRNIAPRDLCDWMQNGSLKPVLVDVRESQELAIAPFPAEVMHFPLSQSSLWIGTLPERIKRIQPIVVICHSGIRSWDFATWLIEQDWGYQVWNLEGGIDAWSVNVDSSVPRY